MIRRVVAGLGFAEHGSSDWIVVPFFRVVCAPPRACASHMANASPCHLPDQTPRLQFRQQCGRGLLRDPEFRHERVWRQRRVAQQTLDRIRQPRALIRLGGSGHWRAPRTFLGGTPCSEVACLRPEAPARVDALRVTLNGRAEAPVPPRKPLYVNSPHLANYPCERRSPFATLISSSTTARGSSCLLLQPGS